MIITISTHKGGSGKTTLATNIASTIADFSLNFGFEPFSIQFIVFY